MLFPGRALDDYATELFAGGARCVVLKKGERGVEGMSANGERVTLAGHQVEVLDPTGAGDCFCATFVALIATGAYGFEAALECANTAGALAVTKIGPMEGASHLATIEAFLEAQR